MIRFEHMHARVGAFEALGNTQASGRLQKQTDQKATDHDHAHQPRHAGRLQVEAVAIEHDPDNGAEHDQRKQPGDHGIDQTFLDVDRFGNRNSNRNGHTYTFATSGRPSRPWGRKIRISTSRPKLNTSL